MALPILVAMQSDISSSGTFFYVTFGQSRLPVPGSRMPSRIERPLSRCQFAWSKDRSWPAVAGGGDLANGLPVQLGDRVAQRCFGDRKQALEGPIEFQDQENRA
jgi:hypothetical protein